MGLVKRTYTDRETVITAENLNEIQDAILALEDGLFSVDNEKSGDIITITDAAKRGFRSLNIYGKTTQAGTPTPDIPVDLISAGDSGSIAVAVCGANLVDINNLTHASGSNGSYSVRGDVATVSGKANWSRVESKVIPATPGATIYLSCKGITGGNNAFITTYCVDTVGKLRNFGPGLTAAGKVSFKVPDYAVKIGFRMYSNGTETTLTAPIEASFDSVMMSFVDVEYEHYKGQTITISTPNGLPGIKVASGGNYTDANGQQWICDEIDFFRGVYVKRINTLNPQSAVKSYDNYAGTNRVVTVCTDATNSAGNVVGAVMCDSLPTVSANDQYSTNTSSIANVYGNIAVTIKDITTENDVIQWLIANPIKIQYVLATPIETPLTEEELGAYAALYTYKVCTTVSNDAGAYMGLEYVMDAKKYIDSLVVGGGASAGIHNATVE